MSSPRAWRGGEAQNNQGGREICKTMKVTYKLDCYSPNLTMLELEAQIERQEDLLTIG